MGITRVKNLSANPVRVLVSSISIFLVIFFSGSISAKDRFAPPDLNITLNDFDNRLKTSIFNVDFIVAHVLNNARQVERLGENIRSNVSIFTEAVNSGNGAVSNSVIIPPGTNADTIIVINQNDGDSYAIQR